MTAVYAHRRVELNRSNTSVDRIDASIAICLVCAEGPPRLQQQSHEGGSAQTRSNDSQHRHPRTADSACSQTRLPTHPPPGTARDLREATHDVEDRRRCGACKAKRLINEGTLESWPARRHTHAHGSVSTCSQSSLAQRLYDSSCTRKMPHWRPCGAHNRVNKRTRRRSTRSLSTCCTLGSCCWIP